MSSISALLSSARTFRREVVRKIRQVGVFGTLRHSGAKAVRGIQRLGLTESEPFDLKYGTDTAVIVPAGALDISNEQLTHCNRYEAVGTEHFLSGLRALPIAYDEFTFIDIGCGKGRPLLLAALFPFKRIIGIDISTKLTAIARRNIDRFVEKDQKCLHISVILGDATAYELPQGNLVLYLNNPFDRKLMEQLLANIERSMVQFPREVYAIYHNPQYRDCWEKSSAFIQAKTGARYIMYQSRT